MFHIKMMQILINIIRKTIYKSELIQNNKFNLLLVIRMNKRYETVKQNMKINK